MNHRKLAVTVSAGAALSLMPFLTGSAQAQRERTPEERAQRRQERQDRIQNMTPEERAQWQQNRRNGQGGQGDPNAAGGPGGGGQGGGGRNFANMTPEQRQAMMAQMELRRQTARADWLKAALTASGTTDANQQNAVIAFMQAQEKAHLTLQEQARQLSVLLVDPQATPEGITTALAAFRKAVAADQTRYTTELAALDTQIKYSTQPKLETLLTILGVIGPEASEIGGVGAIFPDSPFGNRMGGGRGGRNGGGANGGGNGGGNGAQPGG